MRGDILRKSFNNTLAQPIFFIAVMSWMYAVGACLGYSMDWRLFALLLLTFAPASFVTNVALNYQHHLKAEQIAREYPKASPAVQGGG